MTPGEHAVSETSPAFQDEIPGNHCYGCGPHNAQGLRIKSHWSGEREARCVFRPEPHHCAGPSKYVNGGIIATLIDCHAVCTAMAYAYRQAGRRIGEGEPLSYATGALNITYRRPADITRQLTLDAQVVEVTPKKTVLSCSVHSDGAICAEAQVIAVRVPANW